MRFAVEIEKEKDGRWIAEIPQIPGAMAYGCTRAQAVSRVEALALRVLAKRIEHGETSPLIEKVFSVAAGMSQWGSAKARKVLAALLRIGWTIKRESRGSHRILSS
jgi:predicted RNase H-like HicB family nuclease